MGSRGKEGDTLQVSALLGPRPLGASTTYFRVSRLLQVEQEKQCTHQALLRADTTVRVRWGLSGPPRPARGPAVHTEGQLGTQLQDPQPRERGGTGPGAGRGHRDRGLTIALDHVAAGIADVPKEL